MGLHESINKARRAGNWFVKKPARAGSPYAEAQAARVFKAIGLPHLHAEVRKGHVLSPWVDGLRSISEDPHAVRAHADPARVAHLTFGEWLVGAGDRIGRNYQTHPTLGLIGNDYGHAFHPLTDEWPDWAEAARAGKNLPVESYKSLAATPTKFAEYHPHVSALPGLLRHLGHSREDQHAARVPDQAVKAALDNEADLLDAANEATRDLPAVERQLAVHAMRMRLAAVRRHVTNRGPLTVGDLVRLTDEVRHEASTRGPRPG